MRKVLMGGIGTVVLLCACAVPQEKEREATVFVRSGAANHYARQTPYENENVVDTASEFDAQADAATRRAQVIANHVAQLQGIEAAAVTLRRNHCVIEADIVSEAWPGGLADSQRIMIENDIEACVRRVDGRIKRVAVRSQCDPSREGNVGYRQKADGHFSNLIRQLKPVT